MLGVAATDNLVSKVTSDTIGTLGILFALDRKEVTHMRQLSLIFASLGFFAAKTAVADNIPPDLTLGRVATLSGSDYHEMNINVPADLEALCLTPNTLYELTASSSSLNLVIYVHNQDDHVSRAGAWALAHSRELTDLVSGSTYFLATLRFRTPTSTGSCVRLYAVVSVELASSTYYGAYRVRLRQQTRSH